LVKLRLKCLSKHQLAKEISKRIHTSRKADWGEEDVIRWGGGAVPGLAGGQFWKKKGR